MKFRLTYTGPLKSNSRSVSHVHDIRRALHPQLKLLWQRPAMRDAFRCYAGAKPQPRKGVTTQSLRETAGGISFLPLVSEKLHLHANLDILFLRPSSEGPAPGLSGDLDNRLKTLIDALRIPAPHEIPNGWLPEKEETPLYCLLRDDRLVTSFSLASDQWLESGRDINDIHCIIHVTVGASKVLLSNQEFIF